MTNNNNNNILIFYIYIYIYEIKTHNSEHRFIYTHNTTIIYMNYLTIVKYKKKRIKYNKSLAY